MIQKPRGTIDILPDESRGWQWVEKILKETADLYGYGEIRIPTIESSELYKRGVGETSDVVQKEMYTFEDNDRRSITLRPEGTAGVVRSVIENSLFSGVLPLPLYYLVSCFRYEKPEAGRSREFYQFGVELFGAESPSADANVISLGDEIFKRLGIEVSLEINSIGCRHCRPKYHKALHDYYNAHRDSLCETCLDRLEKNPLRILDCKSPVCASLSEAAPKTTDYLCPDCHEHLETLKRHLDTAGIKYTVNPKIVRGLDYYQRTVFEFVSDDIGSKSTICGGGRYDGLVEELGGPKLSGIGFAMGLTRVMLALKAKDKLPLFDASPSLYIASMGDEARLFSFELSLKLKKHGITADFDQVGRSLKAQMKYADKIGAKYSVVLGESELQEGVATLKNMHDGTTKQIDINDADALAQLLI